MDDDDDDDVAGECVDDDMILFDLVERRLISSFG
jgi:hypothetical protein